MPQPEAVSGATNLPAPFMSRAIGPSVSGGCIIASGGTELVCPTLSNLWRSPPPPRRNGTGGIKKSGNLWFFLTGRRFESQDFASPRLAIARGEVPLLRRQALVGQPDLRGPKFVRHVEDAAVYQGGETIAGHTLLSVPSLLETSSFAAFQCFEFSDGNLGLRLAGKAVRGVE